MVDYYYFDDSRNQAALPYVSLIISILHSKINLITLILSQNTFSSFFVCHFNSYLIFSFSALQPNFQRPINFKAKLFKHFKISQHTSLKYQTYLVEEVFHHLIIALHQSKDFLHCQKKMWVAIKLHLILFLIFQMLQVNNSSL